MGDRWYAFSLIDDPLVRLQRALRLAPREGFRAPRRALFFLLVTWAPIMVSIRRLKR